jgi:aryl-alcohol dehydrogenase-like predicted oxidoreductase
LTSKVKAVAAEASKTPAQIALSWLLHDRRVGSVILGCRTTEQILEGRESGDWDLPDEFHQRLSRVVPFVHGYPHEWIQLAGPNIEGSEF